ncbi:hypothetical protein [uncultured Bacteroides sp.]|jgi:hypothetical protein|uniref:hypothetical protein n=1 Tax=uncultured Bacteroides sp. TaxID=162156 RepID=UPI0025846A44|nr:hypothetical protein [uncultured Bacteroides sp.]
MNDYYIKRYWEEEDILFYLHFHNKLAVRQIEVLSGEAVCLTIENPIQGEHLLCDKELDDLSFEESDYISEEEFNKVWSLSFI